MTAVPQSMAAVRGSVAVGAVLFAAAAAWVTVTGIVSGSPAGPTVALIAGSGAAVASSSAIARIKPAVVPAAVVGAAAGILVVDAGGVLRSGPLQGPFGYANATAAFCAQACLAALMLVTVSRALVARVVAGIAAAAFAGVVVLTRSWTAALVLPALVFLALAVDRARGARASVAASAGVFVVVLVLTIGIGAVGLGRSGGPIGEAVDVTISRDRVMLWHEALTLAAQEPLFGVGPGRFSAESPIASSDDDLRWAHHEFLQMGAESGLLAALLGVAIFLWGFAALWLGPPSRVALLGATGLALLGIHASVDYVLHFPAVALAGAAVLGAGLGAPRSRPTAASVELREPR